MRTYKTPVPFSTLNPARKFQFFYTVGSFKCKGPSVVEPENVRFIFMPGDIFDDPQTRQPLGVIEAVRLNNTYAEVDVKIQGLIK